MKSGGRGILVCSGCKAGGLTTKARRARAREAYREELSGGRLGKKSKEMKPRTLVSPVLNLQLVERADEKDPHSQPG